jgi:hypothetical protein
MTKTVLPKKANRVAHVARVRESVQSHQLLSSRKSSCCSLIDLRGPIRCRGRHPSAVSAAVWLSAARAADIVFVGEEALLDHWPVGRRAILRHAALDKAPATVGRRPMSVTSQPLPCPCFSDMDHSHRAPILKSARQPAATDALFFQKNERHAMRGGASSGETGVENVGVCISTRADVSESQIVLACLDCTLCDITDSTTAW